MMDSEIEKFASQPTQPVDQKDLPLKQGTTMDSEIKKDKASQSLPSKSHEAIMQSANSKLGVMVKKLQSAKSLPSQLHATMMQQRAKRASILEKYLRLSFCRVRLVSQQPTTRPDISKEEPDLTRKFWLMVGSGFELV